MLDTYNVMYDQVRHQGEPDSQLNDDAHLRGALDAMPELFYQSLVLLRLKTTTELPTLGLGSALGLSTSYIAMFEVDVDTDMNYRKLLPAHGYMPADKLRRRAVLASSCSFRAP